MSDALKIGTLCTGNVARSVMLGYMLETLKESSGANWLVRSAGTHVVEGLAMSGRTRDALQRLDELGAHHYNAHRSHQLNAEEVAWADVILASEADHVRYVRSNFPEHAGKAVQLYQFVRHAPLDAPFDEQLALALRWNRTSTSTSRTRPAAIRWSTTRARSNSGRCPRRSACSLPTVTTTNPAGPHGVHPRRAWHFARPDARLHSGWASAIPWWPAGRATSRRPLRRCRRRRRPTGVDGRR